jgi:amidase
MPRNAILIEELAIGGAGYRVTVKDSIDIAGQVTRLGSGALANVPAAVRNADVVDALLNAGCRIVGKANMHELAYGVTGINRWAGTPPNPLFPGRIPGGSSSGSAASVAARICDFSLGTDTGGSVRMPAACCGVVGLKPTFGRISRAGAHPARSSLDCIGPLADSIEMLEIAMRIIDPAFTPLAVPLGLRLGLVSCQIATHVAEPFERALLSSECDIIPVNLSLFDAAFAANITVIGAETWSAFGHLVDSASLGDDVRGRLIKASTVTPSQLAHAEQIRATFRSQVDAALEAVDALVLPTLPDFPPMIEDASDARAALGLTSLVRQFNLSGHPALTVPLGTSAGAPIGIQLVGRIGGDADLCAAARRFAASIETLQPLPDKEPCQ